MLIVKFQTQSYALKVWVWG